MGTSHQSAADGYKYCGDELSLIKMESCADGDGEESERVWAYLYEVWSRL